MRLDRLAIWAALSGAMGSCGLVHGAVVLNAPFVQVERGETGSIDLFFTLTEGSTGTLDSFSVTVDSGSDDIRFTGGGAPTSTGIINPFDAGSFGFVPPPPPGREVTPLYSDPDQTSPFTIVDGGLLIRLDYEVDAVATSGAFDITFSSPNFFSDGTTPLTVQLSSGQFVIQAIPEPGSFALMGGLVGLVGVAGAWRLARRRADKAAPSGNVA